VAQGDLKTYVQNVVIPDETRLRELYYAVDERAVALLQTNAEIMKQTEQNDRNRCVCVYVCVRVCVCVRMCVYVCMLERMSTRCSLPPLPLLTPLITPKYML
jgi:hypothetical protein